MIRKTYDIDGFTVVLDKVIHVSPVFDAANDEGAQFNIRLLGDVRLPMKYPDRAAATLQRELFVEALSSTL